MHLNEAPDRRDHVCSQDWLSAALADFGDIAQQHNASPAWHHD